MLHDLTLALLSWYDQHKRQMPWRKDNPDPYHVWLCEVMSQQTTMAAVTPYFLKFIQTYPTIKDLAQAPEADVMALWAGLGYYSRARNLIKAAKIIAEKGFPERLEDLPGVGRYTAAAINTMAFGKPDVVVDGNVERVTARIFAVATPLPKAKPELYAKAADIYAHHQDRPGALAQAFMDLGSLICTPRNPKCTLCPVETFCLTRSDLYPKREAKKAKPERAAIAYWIENEKDEVLFEKRPAKGLLGGTTGLPSTDLKTGAPPDVKLEEGEEIGRIRHVFTHFALTLTIKKAALKNTAFPEQFFWMKPGKVGGLSSLFAKAVHSAKLTNV